MSKAEELLNDLTNEETELVSTEPTEEPHIIIGSDRYITVPDQLKRIAVQFDHNIETVTFDCPRYWDEHDMSKMKIYINYMRSDKAMGSYIAKNIAVDEADDKIMHFTWTISKEVTLIHGKLSFLVCINTVDGDGNETNHWNSELNDDMYVSQGLEVKESVLDKYPDIITQLLIRMDEVEYKTTQKALLDLLNEYLENDPEMQEALKDYITDFMREDPEAEETIYNCVSEYIESHLKLTDESLSVKGTPADAAAVGAALTEIKEIIQTKKGNILVYDNVANSGFHGLSLYGRSEQFTTSGAQLLNVNKFNDGTDVGITWLFQDGYVKVSGVATSNSMRAIDINLEAGMYALNGLNEGDLMYRVIVTTADGIGKYYYDTFVITGTEISVRIQFQVNMYSNIKEFIFYPMLNKGSVVLPWEPYTGGKPSPSVEYPQDIVRAGKDGSVEVGVYGKNLFDTSNVIKNSGSNFSMSGNTITAYGAAAWAQSGLVSMAVKSGAEYIVSGEISGGNSASVQIQEADTRKPLAILRGGDKKVSFVVPKGVDSIVVIYVINGTSTALDAQVTATFKDVMIRLASIKDDTYEPHKEQTLTALTPNGLPAIKVTDASLATYTDEDGQMWCSDEVDFERGVYIQRVLCETVSMGYVSTKTNTKQFDGKMSHKMLGRQSGGLCSHSNKYLYTNGDEEHFYIADNSYNVHIYVGLDEELTVVTVAGILAKPITTLLSTEELAAYKALYSNNPTTTIMNSENVHMKAKVVTGEVGSDIVEIVENEVDKVRDEFIPNNDIIIKSNTKNGFKARGWYRFAKLVGDDVATAKGAWCNSAEIIIKRGYNAVTSEYHHILLASRYYNSLLYPFVSYCNGDSTHLFTKIRQVLDIDNKTTYLELYYASDTSNHAVIQLLNTSTIEGFHWDKADIELAQAQEDLGSLELLAQMDIPLNCHPSTTEDILNTMSQVNANTSADKIAGALALKELSESIIQHSESRSIGTPNQAGWYRIAKLNARSFNKAMGSAASSAEIILKRDYQNNESEYHRILFRQVYYSSEIVPIEAKSVSGGSHIIMKIRHVVDSANGVGYIDLYYRASTSNSIGVQINNAVSTYDSLYWEAVAPTPVSEDIGNMTLCTEVDLPENCRPTTALDILNNMSEVNANTSADKIAGALALKELALKTFNIIDGGAYENCNNLPLGSIVYTYGNSAKNDPFEGNVGIVFTYGTATNWHVNQIAMRKDGSEIKFRACTSGNWSNWDGLSKVKDLANYLPLSGGTLSGDARIRKNLGDVDFYIQNSNRELSFGLGSDGKGGIYDHTHKKWMLWSDKSAAGLNVPGKLIADSMYVGTSEVVTEAKLPIKQSVAENTAPFDFNAMQKAGMYRFNNYDSFLNGPPGSMSYGNAFVMRYADRDTQTILAFPYTANRMYFKSGTDNNFANVGWNKVLTAEDFVVTGSTSDATLTINLD